MLQLTPKFITENSTEDVVHKEKEPITVFTQVQTITFVEIK